MRKLYTRNSVLLLDNKAFPKQVLGVKTGLSVGTVLFLLFARKILLDQVDQ
jgi:hypothetical protein